MGGVEEQTKAIQIPIICEAKEFYAPHDKERESGIVRALRECQQEGYEAQFMPRIIDSRIIAPAQARVWRVWWCAPSVRVTGRTSQGNPVVVYAHCKNYFSKPDNIETAIEQGLRNGAGIMPQNEFQKLVDLNEITDEVGERLVWIVDYNELKDSSGRVISVKSALEHPQTIPFCGGEDRAQKYLEEHKEVYGNHIGIWYSDDLDEIPRGRLLFVGGSYDGGLRGRSLDLSGRFVGVKKPALAGARENLPDKKQLIKIVDEFLAPVNIPEVKKG